MKLPALIPVTSSNIDAMGHDAKGLVVRFKSGGAYRYRDVPKSIFDAGLKAESVGSWFRDTIRGRYKHDMLDDV